MDKYEYKLRAQEIMKLIDEKEYAQAMSIANTIDWRRVKNVRMLTTVSDLYKINRKYEESKDLLLLAYDRYPGGRTIVYSLCELCIKLGEFVQATEYLKEFVRIAPNDTGRFILLYKLYDLSQVSLEKRIQVLEEFKQVDYREKWGYELAFLYHKIGNAAQCVAECDELILTFGEGKYVIKAMELKMMYQPLTPVQQERYDNRNSKKMTGASKKSAAADAQAGQSAGGQQEDIGGTTKVVADKEMDIQVRTLDMGNDYNTLNMQEALADSMKELEEQERLLHEQQEQERLLREQQEQERLLREQQEQERLLREQQEQERLLREQQEQERMLREQQEQERMLREQQEQERLLREQQEQERLLREQQEQERLLREQQEQEQQELELGMDAASIVQNMAERAAMSVGNRYDQILSLEGDGQISLVVPEEMRVEKQITGQLSIQEVLAGWERMKQEADRKSKDDLKQRVMQQTGKMFSDFDASTRSGILEGLEDADSTLENLPIQPMRPEPEPKSETERLIETAFGSDADEEEELPEVEELAEIEDTDDFAGAQEDTVQADADPFDGVEEIAEETDSFTESEDIAEDTLPGSVTEEAAGEEPAGIQEPESVQVPEQGNRIGTETNELEAAIIEAQLEEQNAARANEEKLRAERAARKESAGETGFSTSEMQSVSDKLIENAEREVSGESEKPQTHARALTDEEKELFGALIQTDQMKQQIAEALDHVSLAAYTGNIIITGESGSGTMTLAKSLIKSVQMSDSNFSGQVARISGAALDKKDIPATLSRLRGGAIIIEKANGMSAESLKKLKQYLEKEAEGMIVILEDTKIEMHKCLNKNPQLQENFNARIDINAMDDNELVAYAKKYAYDQEYSIDELGVLALHTRISDLQIGDHHVTLAEVRDIMDEAIWSANRKNLKHFTDILSGKRYDNEDMIVLREKDFIC